MDLNCDGVVCFSEFRKVVEPFVVGAQDSVVKELFDRWDADGSGTMDVGEFTSSLFKSEGEREFIQQKSLKVKQDKQAVSVKSDDIIEQAKAKRAAREQQHLKENIASIQKRGTTKQVPERKVQERLSSYKKSTPMEDHESRTVNGPFTLSDISSQKPDTVRYKVSNSWVPVHPPTECSLREEITRSSQLPKQHLELEFVYSVNYRAGIHSLKSGEVVYAVAGLGVVYNPESHTQRFFRGHIDDVTCVAVDPSETYAATGCMGKSPVVHVWNIKTMELVASTKLGFYERLISAVSFSCKDPKLLVAIGGDNHHCMGLWDWTTGRLLAETPTQNGTPPQVTQIVFDDENTNKDMDRFVTCGFKHFKIWSWDGAKLSGGKNAKYGKISPMPRDMKCAAFLQNNTCLSGGSNGCIYIWDLGTAECKRAIPAHDGPVMALLTGAQGVLLSTGGKDGSLIVWSSTNATSGGRALAKKDSLQLPEGAGACLTFLDRGKAAPVIVVVNNRNSLWAYTDDWNLLIGGHFGDLYGLSIHPSNASAFVTVGEDKQICIWDSKTKQRVKSVLTDSQLRSASISRDGSKIAVGCKDGSFLVLNAADLRIIFKAKHCLETIDCLSFSSNGSLLAVGSHDNYVDVYNCDTGFAHMHRLKGHSSYITHLDWSTDSRSIQSNCGSYEILIWDVLTGKRVTNSERIKSIEWSTHTCVLGFDIMGIWQPGFDGTDINALDRSPDHSLVAFGDDSGNVHLASYPCLVKHAPTKVNAGHSSHVMNVGWLSDGKRLVSVGGHDRAVLQWARVETEDSRNEQTQSDVIRPANEWKQTSAWK